MPRAGDWSTAWSGRGNLTHNTHMIARSTPESPAEDIVRARRRTTRLVTAAGGTIDDLTAILDALGINDTVTA